MEGLPVPTIDDSLPHLLGPRLRFAEPLSRHTSFRIGGPADVWAEVENPQEIRAVQAWAVARQLPLVVLGGGTNVLVSDRGVRAVVLHLGRAFSALEWRPNGQGQHVRAGAAVPFKRLVSEAIDRQLAGLEFAEGIPGTLGGGLLMNAGAFGGEISDVLSWIEGVDANGALQRRARSELRFGYRRFDLEPGFIVTALEMLLPWGTREAILAKRDDAKRRREQHQPLGFPNAGSIFKNPPGQFAGRLIESVGLKGHRIGNAMFAERHANFIVNCGAARAADVRALMDEAIQRVYTRYGLRLEPEIRLVGDW